MKTKKILIVALLFMLITISLMPIANATINPDTYRPSDLDFRDISTPFLKAKRVISAITTVGVVVSVVTTMFLGIKYMVASVEQKAEYKKTMIPIIVGMVMLFCSSTIVSIIYSIMENIK